MTEPTSQDMALELRFALAEGDAVDTPAGLRGRVVEAAAEARAPGRATDQPAHISGAEVFARIVERLGSLLEELTPDEWARRTPHYDAVQLLVGHLIGVEDAFLTVLRGGPDPAVGSDHRAMTAPSIAEQEHRDPATTLTAWRDRTHQVVALARTTDPQTPVAFYGTTMPIDDLLVARAFEMWTHEEDVRRATGRGVVGPDAETLARMVVLAIGLLPVGAALAGRDQPDRTARLVLTGPGGGTWDVNLDGSPAPRAADARVVVDAAWFCRVVGDRADGQAAGALVDGAADVAADLLVGASALAFD
jgi:uncharacterized protein (TIGR03083 family)